MNHANYFDHAGTTPTHPEVTRAMVEVLTNHFGNPSSVHQFGRDAHRLVGAARKTIAELFHAKESEIIFTSGGTESDNMAILGAALQHSKRGKHLITSAIEHPAVLQTMKFLEEKCGFDVTYLPVDQQGKVSVADFQHALREETVLVSLMFANNETGILLPIQKIGSILHAHSALFHVDAVQAVGLLPIVPEEFGIDLLSVSAHKLNGPKGVGVLYKREGVRVSPLLHGGEQENRQRAGTENVAGIVGFQRAVELLDSEEKLRRLEKYESFQMLLLKRLDEAGVSYRVNGDLKGKLPHILNVQLHGVANTLALMKLDLKGFALSAGSACTAGTVRPSHVLSAMFGEAHAALTESLRISFGSGNTLGQVEALAAALIELAREVQ